MNTIRGEEEWNEDESVMVSKEDKITEIERMVKQD
jgi:hypothetical protein